MKLAGKKVVLKCHMRKIHAQILKNGIINVHPASVVVETRDEKLHGPSPLTEESFIK